MQTVKEQQIIKNGTGKESLNAIDKSHESIILKPNVFEYVNYRIFLQDTYLHKKHINHSFSESAFIQAAGFGKTSRGYLGLIIKEKRNLTTKTIIGFATAMKLSPKEMMFFENMVYFNQAETEEEKVFFFERMKVSSINEKKPAFEILESQYRYVSQWYLLALREVVNLTDFKEDEAWIAKKMRGQITKDEASEGIKDLLNLGLITRDISGRLIQSEPIITFNENQNNFTNSLKLHQEFNDRAKILLEKDPYTKRSARLTTLSCKTEDFEALRTEMKIFSDLLLSKYGADNKKESNVVLQLGMQLFHITE